MESITGFGILFGGNLVSWKSKKQNTVSRSSVQFKYRAMAYMTIKVMWILKLLEEFIELNLIPYKIYYVIASNQGFHERTKYIQIVIHFIWEKKIQCRYY